MYKDLTLVPRVCSTLEHRSEAETSIVLTTPYFEITLQLPLIAAPMGDVCNGKMAGKLSLLGAMGIIHRFQSVEDQVSQFQIAKNIAEVGIHEKIPRIGCAIPAKNWADRYIKLFEAGCRIFCIDTANGFSKAVEDCIRGLAFRDNIFLIAGNVATKEGYWFLRDLGVNAVRVGIAGGSVCTTKTETGIHLPTWESVLECYENRKLVPTSQPNVHDFTNQFLPLIIADGGISEPADMCKALALGADLVMAGGIFAGCDESPGAVIKIDGELKKIYRGAASYSTQIEASGGEKPEYNEGNETMVPYTGSAVKVIQRFSGGLRSSMSYMNARDLRQYRQNVFYKHLLTHQERKIRG